MFLLSVCPLNLLDPSSPGPPPSSSRPIRADHKEIALESLNSWSLQCTEHCWGDASNSCLQDNQGNFLFSQSAEKINPCTCLYIFVLLFSLTGFYSHLISQRENVVIGFQAFRSLYILTLVIMSLLNHSIYYCLLLCPVYIFNSFTHGWLRLKANSKIASQIFVLTIHDPLYSSHKGPVMEKAFPCHSVGIFAYISHISTFKFNICCHLIMLSQEMSRFVF